MEIRPVTTESLMEKADRIEREMDLLIEYVQELSKRFEEKTFEDTVLKPKTNTYEVKN